MEESLDPAQLKADEAGAASRARSRYAPLAVIALSMALAYGIWYAYSVFLVALLREFGWSRSVLAGAFSVFALVQGFAYPAIGALCVPFRPAAVLAVGGAAIGVTFFAVSFITTPLQLYLGFGVATALAVSAAGYTPALVYVQRAFPDRLGLAMGLVGSGISLGMFAVVPLAQVLIEAFGWRTALQLLGLAAALWIVPSSLWLMRLPRSAPVPAAAPPAPRARPSPASRALTLAQAMRTQPFWLLLFAFLFGNWATQTLHVHQVAYLVEQGLPALAGASVVSVVGLASILGKTGGGWLSDRLEREQIYIAGIAILAASAFALLALAGSPTSWAPYGYAVLFGVGYSVTASLIPAIVSDRFNGPHFGAIVGAGLFGSAVGSALGPWLAGLLYDTTGSYTLPFMISAASAALAGAAVWRTRTLRRRAGP